MKKLLIISILIPLFLVSCGKTEEIKTTVNAPVTGTKIIKNESIIEINTGNTDNNPTGVISETGIIDNISIDLEKTSPYGSFSGIESNGIKYRIGTKLLGSDSFKVNQIQLNNDFNLNTQKLGLINLFVVNKGDTFINSKEIVQKYFINTKYEKYCTLHTINTKNEITSEESSTNHYNNVYISKNLFLGKDNWEIHTISINENITPEMNEKTLNNGYCFGVGFSAPKQYFIFKKGDLTKFLLINTTQDPYPFNPRSFDF